MIPKDRERLAKAHFPIAEVSRHAAREKSIRSSKSLDGAQWSMNRCLVAGNGQRLSVYAVSGGPSSVPGAWAGAIRSRAQEPIKDPARFEWNEVTKVAHYYLAVDALTKPSLPGGRQVQVREDSPPYGEPK